MGYCAAVRPANGDDFLRGFHTQATLYLSAWVLQPYVDLDRLELLLAAVAAESDSQTASLQSPMRSPAARSPGKPR